MSLPVCCAMPVSISVDMTDPGIDHRYDIINIIFRYIDVLKTELVPVSSSSSSSSWSASVARIYEEDQAMLKV